MVNPLLKRIPKELIGEWRKYGVVSLLLILTIGFVSGMYVANGSMMEAATQGKIDYKLEDGHFELTKEETEFEDDSVRVYKNYFRNAKEGNGTIRIYTQNDKINQACLMEGKFPENENEIAIDRMHANNANIQVGDTIQLDGESFQVCGLLAYVNYSTLHEKNTDFMFDALNFDVGMVSEEGFNRVHAPIHYAYAWHYKKSYKDDIQQKEYADDFLKSLVSQCMMSGNSVEDFVPLYANSAVNFTSEDMGSDMAMGGVILNILIVIIAFIFAITVSATIQKEAGTIGVLRASGYTKFELLTHFMAMPVIVTLVSCLIGNILGYTVFKNVVIGMYYNSYSLPTYHTIWNSTAFVKTTLIPIVLMFVVNLVVLVRKLQYSPLQFLRHDLKKTKRAKAIRLPKISFFGRFRLRILFQNISNYIVLTIGIFFVSVMLAMAIGMPSTLKYYQDNVEDMMFCDYQYVLKNFDQDISAEKYSMKSTLFNEEEISVYGIEKNSKFVQLPTLKKGEVMVSSPFAQKYKLEVGDSVKLHEKYEDKSYTFKVASIYEDCASLSTFVSMDMYRDIFDIKEDAFTGYFSNTELKELKEEDIATVITQKDITKMVDQLDHSMGAYMVYFQYMCIFVSALLMYLLTKIIIEKNETSISMIKILGYSNKEIFQLYLLLTTIVVLIADVICTILGVFVMSEEWKMIMYDYNGWFTFYMEPMGYVKMFSFIFIGYILVLLIDFRRIQKIPMDEALKNVE